MHLESMKSSRRHFLGLGAAGLAGLTLSRTSAFGEDAPATMHDFGGLPMGVQSYTLRDRSFEKALDAIKDDLKLNFVEIWNGHVTGIGPTKIKQMLETRGIKASGWGVVGFSKDSDANRKVFELAKGLGIPHITCDPDPDSFDSLDKLTEEFDITADIHDHGPGHRWGKIDVIWAAIKDHSKRVGLCNDTGHFIRAGEDPLRACEVFGDRIHAMHVKDFKQNANGQWEDCGLGQGGLKLDALMKWLLARNFGGDLSLEYEGGNPVKVCQGDLGRIEKTVAEAKKAHS
jgi:sugar phosphate isomerase/epimerase